MRICARQWDRSESIRLIARTHGLANKRTARYRTKESARTCTKLIAILGSRGFVRRVQRDRQSSCNCSPTNRTSYLQSTTSSQAQIKCSLYPPCFPTTITNHHHRRHYQRRRGCRCRRRMDSACSSLFTVYGCIAHCASKTLSLARALRILRPPLGSLDPGVNEVGSENAPRRVVQMRSLPSFNLFGGFMLDERKK